MANNLPEHPMSEKHSFSPVFKNGGYAMSTLARYAISFVLGALSAAFFAGGKSRDVSDLLIRVGKVEATTERMDRDGTNASRWMLNEEGGKIAANKVLIEELQKKLEPIGTMQSKIERLERDVAAKK